MNIGLIQKRLIKTNFFGRILARLPFVRCVILNGSLASRGHKETSDIDILIIAKVGRIFAARFFVILFAIIFRIKRPKDNERGHAGKFCFNYFLTENYLKINCPIEREKYCAENYSKSRFIAGGAGLFDRFMKTNESLFEKYGFEIANFKFQISNKIQNSKFKNYKIPLKCHPELSFCHPEFITRYNSQEFSALKDCSRLISGSPIIKAMTGSRNKFGMTILARLGDWIEDVLKKYQIKKIESDPRTKKYPSLIVYNDQELRFHPPKSR